MASVGTIAAADPQMQNLAKQLRVLNGQPSLLDITIAQLNTLISTDQASIVSNLAQIATLNTQIAARTDALIAGGATSPDVVADPQCLTLGAQITGFLAMNDNFTRHITQIQALIDGQTAQLANLPAQQAAIADLLAARLDVLRGI